MFVLGLTGALAAGKSTVAAMFAAEGAALFDADAAVHALYRGAAAPLVEAAFPGTTAGGTVDRAALAARLNGDRSALTKLEALVHPLIRVMENQARAGAAASGRRLLVLDIPLLFETGGETRVDAVAVASAPEETRRARVLARPGMTAERYAALAARQMDEAEKRRRAHFVIDTGGELAATRRAVAAIVRALAGALAGK